MHKVLVPLILIRLTCTYVFAQTSAWPPSADHVTVRLWPNGAPGRQASAGPEGDTTTAKDRLVAGKRVIRIGNVTDPTLTLYKPAKQNTGAAVVVFPGWQLQDSRD